MADPSFGFVKRPSVEPSDGIRAISQTTPVRGGNVFKIVGRGAVRVTRNASAESGYTDVPAPPTATGFFAFATVPNSSPLYMKPLPIVAFDTSGATAGLVSYDVRGLYDPSVGAVRFFIDCPTNSNIYTSAQTFDITYYLTAETVSKTA